MTPTLSLQPPIRVLDHGYLRLIDLLGSDELVVESARMSTGKGFLGWGPRFRCSRCNSRDTEPALKMSLCTGFGTGSHDVVREEKGDEQLLEFLYRNKHMTPFEVPRLLIEVKAPLFVFREWHRHRTWVYNELSARYTQMPNEHYVPAAERFRHSASANKQAASAVDAQVDEMRAHDFRDSVQNEQSDTYDRYEEMIKGGVPREVARVNTPVSRYSVMRAGVSLRGALDFLVLRDHPAAQWEMQQYARAFAQVVQTAFPRTYALYEEHTKHAVTLSRSEKVQVRVLLSTLVDSAGRVEEPLPAEAELLALMERLR